MRYCPVSYTHLEEIIAYINEHFAEKFSVEELAAKAGLSQYHFIRVFKKETGFTPHEYLNNTPVSYTHLRPLLSKSDLR